MSSETHTIPDHVASRVARLINEAEDMRQQAADDLKQIYADLREELRGMGWTGAVVSVEVAALKGAIADMRMDEQAKSKREEKGERIDDYVSLLTRARAREAVPAEAVRGILAPHYTAITARDYSEATGREPIIREIERVQPETANLRAGPQYSAVPGGEPSIPSSDDGGAKTEDRANDLPGRSDDKSVTHYSQSEQAAKSNSDEGIREVMHV